MTVEVEATTPTLVECPGRVGETVREELGYALSLIDRRAATTTRDAGAVTINAGLLCDMDAAPELIARGFIDLHNVPPGIDGFEIFADRSVLYLIGSTPRGLLQAVYKLQELLRESPEIDGDLAIRETFRIGMRIFHPRFEYWPGTTDDVRYISRIGATHSLHTHDWQGERRRFAGYVKSDIFPNAVGRDVVEEGRRSLRRLIDDCLDYGLESALWITELPCQGGGWVPEPERRAFLDRYPAEVLSDSGTNQGKVLCFGHSDVQAYYRDLITTFFEEFPEISILFVMGLDANGEFCDPEGCPRCRGMSKFEQRDRFLRFLIDEGTRVRPGLRVLTTSWGWHRMDPEEFFVRQRALPKECGLFMAAQVDGWQPERQIHDHLIRAREICRETGQLFIGYDDFHWGDDTVHGLADIQDFPLGIGAKIDRWHRLEADGVFDHWGTWNNDVSTNSIACRRFFTDPAADREQICLAVAQRQFGTDAGNEVFESWRALDRAHAILSNRCVWPPLQWPNWYRGFHAPVPSEFVNRDLEIDERWRMSAPPIEYNSPESSIAAVGASWELAVPHYREAMEHIDRAIAASDDTPLFYDFWWRGDTPTPNRREHLKRQRLYLESMMIVGREIGIHFSLDALSIETDHNDEVFRDRAEALLKRDAASCREAADFFTRVGVQDRYRNPRMDRSEAYLEKARLIEQYLE